MDAAEVLVNLVDRLEAGGINTLSLKGARSAGQTSSLRFLLC